ncbi:11709_t:CDS:2, partial [Funneliformis geosporum]
QNEEAEILSNQKEVVEDFIHEGENNIKKGHDIRKEDKKINNELFVPIANIDDSYSSYKRKMSFGKISLNDVNVEELSQ